MWDGISRDGGGDGAEATTKAYGAEQSGFEPVLVIRSYDPTTRKVEATLAYCLHDHAKPSNDTNQMSGDRLVTEEIVTTLNSDGSFSHTMTIWSGNRWNNADGNVYLSGKISSPEASRPSISLTFATVSPWDPYGAYGYYSNYEYFDMSKAD